MSVIQPEQYKQLGELNTLHVAASARWYCAVADMSELQQTLDFVRRQHCPLLVLGGGSNVVLKADYPGLVLHQQMKGIHAECDAGGQVLVEAAAGESWDALVAWCLQQGYYGLENLSLIPGSVGAAPIQNIGAYGVELAEFVDYVDVVDIASGEGQRLDAARCEFAYRESVFKHALRGRCVIVGLGLRLRQAASWQPNLSYAALADYVADHPQDITPHTIRQAVIAIRRSRLPDPAELPNVGSFFKNPVVSQAHWQRLLQRYPDMPSYVLAGDTTGEWRKLPAAWLIDRLHWKGLRRDGVGVHSEQALVLVNYARCSEPGAAGQAIVHLASEIQASVREAFGVDLEIEPQLIEG